MVPLVDNATAIGYVLTPARAKRARGCRLRDELARIEI